MDSIGFTKKKRVRDLPKLGFSSPDGLTQRRQEAYLSIHSSFLFFWGLG